MACVLHRCTSFITQTAATSAASARVRSMGTYLLVTAAPSASRCLVAARRGGAQRAHERLAPRAPMCLQAELAAWAASRPGESWHAAPGGGVCGALGGARVALSVAGSAEDSELASVVLTTEGARGVVSVTLSSQAFLFPETDALSRLCEAANSLLERSGGGATPLAAALSALADAAAHAPALLAALLGAPPDSQRDGASDDDAFSSDGDDEHYLLATGDEALSVSALRRRQMSFIMRHAEACGAALAAEHAAALASAHAAADEHPPPLQRLRVNAHAASCAVHGWLELLELPEPAIAAALGLHSHLPLRCFFSFSASSLAPDGPDTLPGLVAALVSVEFRQPDAPPPLRRAPPGEGGEEEEEETYVHPELSFATDRYLPELAKELLQEWRDGAAAEQAELHAALHAESHGAGAKRCRAQADAAADGGHFFTWFLRRVWAAIAAATSRCAVCRAPLPAPGAALAPCGRDACAFSFEEVVPCPLLPLLREGGGAPAALHVALAQSAAAGMQLGGARDTFEPFPSFLLASAQQRGRAGFFDDASGGAAASMAELSANKTLGLAAIAAVLGSLPPLAELAALPDEGALRRRLRRCAWREAAFTASGVCAAQVKAAGARWPDAEVPDMAFRVLRFVLTSARFALQPLREPAAQLAGLPAGTAQLAVVGCSEAREERFQERKAAAGGSFWAFHGSPLRNWYSITRNGLRSLSNTPLQANGAVYGAGVYLAQHLHVSAAYSHRQQEWWAQRAMEDLQSAGVACDAPPDGPPRLALVAVVEVARSVAGAAGASGFSVAPHADDVALRYLLLLPMQAQMTGDASALTWGDSDLHAHRAALGERARAAAEATRAELRAQRRAADQAAAAAAAAAAPEEAVDAALSAAAERCEAASGSAAVSATSARAVAKELRELSRAARALAAAVSLPDENDAFRWRVLLHSWGDCAPALADDLRAFAAATGHEEGVELELRFDSQHFPFRPPFVRVVRPVFAFHTGHVTIGGSICMELLTSAGWSAAVALESVLVSIRAEMAAGGARLDAARFGAEYSEAEARMAFQRVAIQHGWERG